MGINAELVNLLVQLRETGALDRHQSVVELGAQDIGAAPEVISALLERAGLRSDPICLARELYACFDYREYVAIDTSGHLDSLKLDLNQDLSAQGFRQQFDLVTNIGTLEHVFDQATAFRNMHQLCRQNGLMIHVLPAQGLANHGFYNYQPRFVWELAAANSYEICCLYFTIDFRPTLYPYSADLFKAHQDRDIMLYGVFRKQKSGGFNLPTDRIFSEPDLVQSGEFRSWIKTTWENARGYEALSPAAVSGTNTSEPT